MSRCFVAFVGAVVLAGCGGGEPRGVTLQPAEEAILAQADAVDGTADKVVANCAGCQLQMAGKAEHALTAGSYAMHFCSENCKTRFSEDLHASIQGLETSGQ
jgi:Fe-S oxidoreductase